MIGGSVGIALGSADAEPAGSPLAPGNGVWPGAGLAGVPGIGGVGTAGNGVLTVPGGFTGPLGAGAGGFTGCAATPNSATTQSNTRLENGARTRRKRLPSSAESHAIFCVDASSRLTADARSVL
jgi:hypothetical protein